MFRILTEPDLLFKSFVLSHLNQSSYTCLGCEINCVIAYRFGKVRGLVTPDEGSTGRSNLLGHVSCK